MTVVSGPAGLEVKREFLILSLLDTILSLKKFIKLLQWDGFHMFVR